MKKRNGLSQPNGMGGSSIILSAVPKVTADASVPFSLISTAARCRILEIYKPSSDIPEKLACLKSVERPMFSSIVFISPSDENFNFGRVNANLVSFIKVILSFRSCLVRLFSTFC